MKFNRYDALYAIFWITIMYLVFSNVRDHVTAAVIMALVLVMAVMEHKHGYFNARQKFDKKAEEAK
ncbi:hypothetical protein [Bacillus sp. XF8]|uniref:hypothetical protein n=1 Tax=Bacillus sp. XF8 TaxID=2819289 RepID=UPI001AA04033|nr:hypothetical protein [Bacillus sp. XF8]MBO1583009.1 hypothetical protein [Bacillus sp. XF8]